MKPIRLSSRVDYNSLRLLLALTVIFPVLLTDSAMGAPTPIGPGVAGQVHALTYDPINPDIIYAGGDNCGVYKSQDHGGSWISWNEGLGTADPRATSYVDDVVVVPLWTGAPNGVAGVYIATRGGIAYREGDSTPWSIDTENLTYRAGYAAQVGAAIPF